MVQLVLNHAREKLLRIQRNRLAKPIQPRQSQRLPSRHAPAKVGNAQASLPILLQFLRVLGNLRIDDDGQRYRRLVRISRMRGFDLNKKNSLRHMNLRAGQAHAISVAHRLDHVVDELLERRRGQFLRVHGQRPLPQNGMTQSCNLQERHKAFIVPASIGLISRSFPNRHLAMPDDLYKIYVKRINAEVTKAAAVFISKRSMPTEQDKRDPGIYLAAERTFLAWIRTGLALMAFGFVVARFGLFLREMEATRGSAPIKPSPLSLPLGVGLVLIGVVINLASCWGHVRYIRRLNKGLPTAGRSATLAIVLALILAIAGVVMAFYLGTTKAENFAPNTKPEEPTSMKTGDGIISKTSQHSVPETLDRLETLLRAKGITIFARVDHSGEAAKVGLKMPPTQVLIFGSPKSGTPVMLAAPTAAIDLPLKALAWQDGDGKVWLSYNDIGYLKRRFALSDDEVKTIAGTGSLIEQAV